MEQESDEAGIAAKIKKCATDKGFSKPKTARRRVKESSGEAQKSSCDKGISKKATREQKPGKAPPKGRGAKSAVAPVARFGRETACHGLIFVVLPSGSQGSGPGRSGENAGEVVKVGVV